jgi:hypothetical protein
MANTTRKTIVDAVENLPQVGSWPAAVNQADVRDLLLPVVRAAIPQVQTIRLIVANLTIVREDVVLVNCTTTNGTGVAVTLPTSPVEGQVVVVKRIDANGGTDAVTVVSGSTLATLTTQHSKRSFTRTNGAWVVGDSSTDSGAAYAIDTEAGIILADNDGSVDLTLTLPLAAESEGRIITVKAVDAGNSVIVDGNGSETVDGAANSDLTTDHNHVTVVCDGAAWHITSFKIGA